MDLEDECADKIELCFDEDNMEEIQKRCSRTCGQCEDNINRERDENQEELGQRRKPRGIIISNSSNQTIPNKKHNTGDGNIRPTNGGTNENKVLECSDHSQ